MDNKESNISIEKAKEVLLKSNGLFVEIFRHGSLVVEFYKPGKTDLQKPHSRDEIYVVAKGEGIFYNDGKRNNFRAGDFLFVPAYKEHHFENYSEDFCTWVFFYGPEGGELT